MVIMVAADLIHVITENIIAVVLVLVVTLFIIYILNRTLTSQKNPPGPIAWPIVGNLMMISRTKNFYQFLKDLRTQYGDVYKLQFGQIPMVIIFGRKNLYNILDGDGENCSQRPDWMFVPREIVTKKGITWANGDQWKKLNKLIIGAQHEKSFQQNMEQQLEKEVNALCKLLQSDQPVNPLNQFYTTFMNVISIMVFGKRYEYDDKEFKELCTLVNYVVEHGQTYNRRETFLSCLAFFTKAEVSKLKAESEKLRMFIGSKLEDHKDGYNPSRPRDLLDVYRDLPASQKQDDAYSEANFFQSIIDLYFGGREGFTASLMTMVFYLLKYPDVQNKCREEIRKVCKGQSHVTLENRNKLPYVESVMKEVLRIAKPVVLSIYRTNKQSLDIGEYTIPPNTVIIFELMDPHVDSKMWQNPNDFNPDRWLQPHSEGYFPFGLGPRRCVGAPTADMAIFLIISNMLMKFELVPEDESALIAEREWSGIALFPTPFKMFMRPVV